MDAVEVAELIAGVKADAEQALDLDSTIGIAHSALASVHIVEGDLTEARAAFLTASELTPNEPYILSKYAQFNNYVGEYAEAIELNRRGVRAESERAIR